MKRIFTGFKSIDNGMQINEGELVVLASRPAIGKTSLICSIIKNTLDSQKGLYFSMQFMKSKAIESIDFTKNNNYEIVEDIVDVDEIIIKTAESKIKKDISVVFIDNFTDLVTCSAYSPKRVILKLKEMAKRLGVAVIVAEVLVRNNKHYYTYYDMRHYDFISLADKIVTMDRLYLEYANAELELNCIKKNTTSICIDKDLSKYLGEEFRLTFDKNTFTFNEI